MPTLEQFDRPLPEYKELEFEFSPISLKRQYRILHACACAKYTNSLYLESAQEFFEVIFLKIHPSKKGRQTLLTYLILEENVSGSLLA